MSPLTRLRIRSVCVWAAVGRNSGSGTSLAHRSAAAAKFGSGGTEAREISEYELANPMFGPRVGGDGVGEGCERELVGA